MNVSLCVCVYFVTLCKQTIVAVLPESILGNNIKRKSGRIFSEVFSLTHKAF